MDEEGGHEIARDGKRPGEFRSQNASNLGIWGILEARKFGITHRKQASGSSVGNTPFLDPHFSSTLDWMDEFPFRSLRARNLHTLL